MNRASSLWGLGLFATLAAACGGTHPEQPTPVTSCHYALGLSSDSFAAAGGSGTATVTTDAGCSWSASSNADWLSIDSTGQHSGPATFRYSVGASPVATTRQASLQVATTSATVHQSACSLGLTSHTETITNTGGRIALSLSGSCPWSARSDSGWVVPEPSSGQGAGQVTLLVVENNGASARTAHVDIAGAVITVTESGEEACSYRLDPSAVQVDYQPGTGHASIRTAPGCGFTISSTESWLRSNIPASASGPVDFTYEFDTYPLPGGTSNETRTASFVVRPVGPGQAPRLTVEQFPNCTILATMPSIPVSGANVFVNVLADPTFSCPWRVVVNAPWLTVSGVTGHGDGGFWLDARANDTGIDRTATILVGGHPKAVTQLGH